VAAAVVLREKAPDEQGNLREMVIWQEEPNPRQPQGIRYRLPLILTGEKTLRSCTTTIIPRGTIAIFKASRNPMNSLTLTV
jgi:hypothetical protein